MPTLDVTDDEIAALRSARSMRAADPAGYAAWLTANTRTSSTATPPAQQTSTNRFKEMTRDEKEAALRARGVAIR